MKKQFLLINTALLLSLVACSSSPTPEPTDNALLKLYDANAKFVSNGFGKDIIGTTWSNLTKPLKDSLTIKKYTKL